MQTTMYKEIDIINIVEKVKEIARNTGEFLKDAQAELKSEDIEMKATRNYVTRIDKEAEQLLVKELRHVLPEAGFLTEEETIEQDEKRYMWCIDPLDGTTNFIHGDTPYSVSIALMDEKTTIMGVVYDPVMSEMYSAIGKGQAFLNRYPIKVNTKTELENGYIGFGIPYEIDENAKRILKNTFAQFQNCSFRIKGSAALEICYVASGGSDAYFHSALSPWDVAAAAFILECAGGKCTDFSGGDDYIFGKEIVASNGAIHDDIMHHIINQ